MSFNGTVGEILLSVFFLAYTQYFYVYGKESGLALIFAKIQF